jgi:hypothetical protein
MSTTPTFFTIINDLQIENQHIGCCCKVAIMQTTQLHHRRLMPSDPFAIPADGLLCLS